MSKSISKATEPTPEATTPRRKRAGRKGPKSAPEATSEEPAAKDAPRAPKLGRRTKAAKAGPEIPPADDAAAPDAEAPVAEAPVDEPSEPEPPKKGRRGIAKKTGSGANRNGSASITLQELGRRFIEHLEAHGKAATTTRSYAADLRLAERVLGAEMPIADLTVDDIIAFNESAPVNRTRDGVLKAGVGVRKTQRVLRLALVYAVEAGLLSEAPLPPKG